LKYIKLFEEHSVDPRIQELKDLEELRSMGIIDPAEYAERVSLIKRQIAIQAKRILKTNSQHQVYSDEWFEDLRKKPEFGWLIEVIDSPEYSALIENGVVLSSSFTQLLNHTLVFSRDVDRNIKADFAIGFFGSMNVVRRLVPKTRMRDMDMVIKKFDGNLSEVDFFKQAMAWTAESVDFTTADFSTKRTVQSNLSKQEAIAEFERVIAEFIKTKMPNTADSQIRKWTEDIHSLIGWNLAEIKPATKALKTWLTTNKAVNLTICSYRPLDGELQPILLNDPRLIIHNRCGYS